MSTAAVPHPSPWSPEVEQQLIAWLSHPDPHMELLGGVLTPKTMAKGRHGAAQLAIGGQLLGVQGPAPDEPGGGPPRSSQGRWWLSQEVDMYIGGEGVRPDVVGWRIDRHPAPPEEENVGTHLGVVTIPPDWICEVLSKSTTARDRGLKWKAYHRAGVEWYWLVDMRDQTLTVYQRNPRSYEVVEVVGPGDVRPLPPFESVEFRVAPLFVYGGAPASAP